MQLVSPSGKTYEWSGDQPPGPGDMAALQAYDAAQGGATPAPTAAPSQHGASGSWRPETTGDKIARIGKGVAASGINIAATSLGAAVGAAIGTPADVVSGPAGTIAGGMAGSAFGNYVGQYINSNLGLQDGIDKGQVAGAALTGAVPGGSLAEAGIGQLVKQGAK